ncbi:hypothetical protein ACWDV7_06190 [Streptomyces sp. NPDC003362]
MSTEARHAPIPPRPDSPPDERPAANPTAPADGTRPPQNPRSQADASLTPPPPAASARFPDLPPPAARGPVPPRSADAPAETATERTTRLRPVPPETPDPAAPAPAESVHHPAPQAPRPRAGTPEPRPRTGVPAARSQAGPVPRHPGRPPAHPPQSPTSSGTGSMASATPAPNPPHSWSAPPAPRTAMPHAFGDDRPLPPPGGRVRRQTVAAAACVVLGLGLIGGAVTGSWLAGDSTDAGERGAFATAAGLWHNVPVDQLFPRTVTGTGAGPGEADRTWTRIAVAPDTGCADAFDPLLRKALAPVGCQRLLRATYTDATQSHVTTVGLLFTKADAAAMRALQARFEDEGLHRRTDLMPRPYAAKGTVAAGFGDAQRASWTVSVLTDAPVVVYAVSGWADGRAVDEPQPAADAMRSGATTAPAQAGLGHEAKGLADRVERGLRKSVVAATEQPS